ncbi:single-stranded DNA-binding protein [Rummeliibacillus pycnus]|uniref:single-stranded DNA-binding protein n=1 Tax=Rummeliibacillus pycnus TaxID=101070 RepID=UPI000C9BFB93|nr:single-stranded DNA-binding protein [Rummeliibacillus pycnus]
MNQVALVGRITKNPELRQLSEGRVQTNFIIAINRNFKNANGDIDADFVSCSVWGKLATNVVKYCGKGSLIGVGGRLQSRSYQRDDGKRVYVVEVIADEVRFLALKEREEKTSKQVQPSEQKNSTMLQTTSEQAQEVPAGFVLPKEEAEGLPMV